MVVFIIEIAESIFSPDPFADPYWNRKTVDANKRYQHVGQIVTDAPILEEFDYLGTVEYQRLAPEFSFYSVGTVFLLHFNAVQQNREKKLRGYPQQGIRIVCQNMEELFVGQHSLQDVFVLSKYPNHTLPLFVIRHEHTDEKMQVSITQQPSCPVHYLIYCSVFISLSRSDTDLLTEPQGPCYPSGTVHVERRHVMVKIFQGDYQTVERDVNNWVEVYKPAIIDFKQSMSVMEHNIIVLLTFRYEAKSETQKVQYRINK